MGARAPLQRDLVPSAPYPFQSVIGVVIFVDRFVVSFKSSGVGTVAALAATLVSPKIKLSSAA